MNKPNNHRRYNNNNNNSNRSYNSGGGNRSGGSGGGKNYSANREKYLNMARDAQSSGDRVQAEYYLQHADHYTRMMAEDAQNRPPRSHHNAPRPGYRDPNAPEGQNTEGQNFDSSVRQQDDAQDSRNDSRADSGNDFRVVPMPHAYEEEQAQPEDTDHKQSV